jgi:putative acetyltransferase
MIRDMQVEIKPYEEKYREQMILVWEKSVRATHHFVTPMEVERLKGLVREIDFNSFSVFCLVSEDKVLGFLGVEDRVIESLFLDPDYIGQKFGSKLMDFALDNLRANKVNVNEQNTEAIKFYTRFGFKTYERTEKDSYGNAYPILKMMLKPDLSIRQINKDEQIPYELLLLSDDTIEAINKNLDKGELLVAENNDKIVAAFILKATENETIEIKNIAVSKTLQGKGIGTALLNHIISTSIQRNFRSLIVGTCDLCNQEIEFYKKSGFEIIGTRKNFFIDNYREPIYENGKQMKDMIILSIDLKTRMS